MAGSEASNADGVAFSSDAGSPFSSHSSGAIHLSTLSVPRRSPFQRKLRRNYRSLDPFQKASTPYLAGPRRSFRSFSYHTPSPSSSESESVSAPDAKHTHQRPSSYLPTPPDTDDEAEPEIPLAKPRTPPSLQSQSSEEEYPFPLQPVCLAKAKQVAPPKTPSRRCFSAGQPRSPKSPFPDRFISNRSTPTTPQSPAETYRVSKRAQDLLPNEKLLRHGSVSPDPFGPLRVSRIRAERINSPRGRGSPVRSSGRAIGGTTVSEVTPGAPLRQNRQISQGNVWNAGNVSLSNFPSAVRGVSNGRGGFISSGSNAPMYESHFLDELSTDHDVECMEQRLSAAMGIDRTMKVLENTRLHTSPRTVSTGSIGVKRKRLFLEQDASRKEVPWTQGASTSLLDAPGLRDDYYCTVLSYCHPSRTLAVGLDNRVYLWSEAFGVRYPPLDSEESETTFITSISFSSDQGGHSILAVGRNNGQISLWSLVDAENVRFTSQQPNAIACISFKPVTTFRPSEKFGSMVPTEELLVGDESGQVYYYSIEWMNQDQVDIHGWNGHMKLLAKIEVHTQQICGLAWSPKGDFFATGANDNICNLFDTKDILKDPNKRSSSPDIEPAPKRPLRTFFDTLAIPNFLSSRTASSTTYTSLSHPTSSRATSYFDPSFPPLATFLRQSTTIIPGQDGSLLISEGRQKQKWLHAAAVKAIAFCPWQSGLIATGGGSNDRAIHFYHVYSGACLATINVHAQVTSLIWSTTRREIAATFGYPQPDHPYRIAVFSWPDCRQVVAIPWASDLRALYAVAYPGGSEPGISGRGNGGRRRNSAALGERWYDRTREEGCIVVASSDESVKFHEIWAGASRGTGGAKGVLGGSAILEGGGCRLGESEGGGLGGVGGGGAGEWVIR